jgi:hypothetical protein
MTYSENICFTTNTHVVSRKDKDYWSYLKDIYNRYLVRGLGIRKIKADLEFAMLQVLVGKLPTRPTMVLAAQGEHVGLIKQNIRFLKEKVRLLRYTLPFTKIPKYMIIHMVFLVTQVMNYFPRKGGNSYYLPGMILTGTGVSVKTLHIPFGLYVQSTESVEPRNSLAAQTRGAIALGSMGNSTGGQIIMALDTGKLIRWLRITVVPMTAEVIARVEKLGGDEPALLTF